MDATEEPYDPYLKREVEHPMTNMEAKINLLKCTLGTGCLAMPIAFSNAGYANGIISTVVIGAIVVYALQILIKSMYKLCKRNKIPLITYRQAMELSLKEGPIGCRWASKIAGYLVDGFLSLYHFGICAVYVVFISATVKRIVDIYAIEIDLRLYMAMLIIPLAILFSIRNLKHLVPFSFIANILLAFGFLVIIGTILFNLPHLSERIIFQKIDRYPLFLGTVLFSMEAVGVIIAIEANMKKPQDFLGLFGILNQGMYFVIFLYTVMGFFGYWQYGDEVEGTITLNLPETVLYDIVKIMFAVAVYLSYALQGYVTVDVIWNQNMSALVDEKRRVALEYVFRMCIVLASVVCAVVFPDFDLFLSLVGSFCLSTLGLIFPAFIDICTRYVDGYGFIKIYLLLDIFIMALGICAMAAGTYSSIASIQE